MTSLLLSPAAKKSLTAKVQAYHDRLPDGPGGSYLSSRGLNGNVSRKFLLGWVPYDDANASIRGRLSIPYLTPTGPVSLKYRCINDHDCKDHGHSKYIYDAGESLRLYNASTLLHTDRVVLCEGEIDAITVESVGGCAVGYPGTAAWKANRHWRYVFDSCSELIIPADGDQPGRDSAESLRSILGDAVNADVRVVYLPDGEDCNSLVVSEGGMEFLDRIGWL